MRPRSTAATSQVSTPTVSSIRSGLPTGAEPLGGWEAPENELRGHFTGHYLTACALLAAGTGDAALAASGRRTVEGLAACQHALGNGYLSAFPESFQAQVALGEYLRKAGRIDEAFKVLERAAEMVPMAN